MARLLVVRAAGAAAVAFFAGLGAWAFLSPESFYDVLATYPPLNEHLLRDAGSFQLGIGAALVAGSRWRDGPVVALTGAAVASLFHAVSHVIDAGAGGRATDPWLLSLFAILVGAGAIARIREVNR